MDTDRSKDMNIRNNTYLKGISVIICTFNGETRIGPTLEALKKQNYIDNLNIEVILVNNRSTDNTEQTAKKIWGNYTIPLRIEYEGEPGVSRARQKGIESAKFEYIVFCDDDNHLFSDYLSIIYNHFETNIDCIMLGGQGIALPEIEVPFWFDNYKESYAAAPQGSQSGPAYMLHTAGMALRKSYFIYLIELGFQFYTTGRIGKYLASGEDSELCYAFHMLGWKIWYNEDMKFYHFIPKGRLTWTYLIRLHIGFSKSYIVLNQYKALLHSDSYKFKPWKELLYHIGICIKYYIPYKKANEGDKIIIHYKGWIVIVKDLIGYCILGKSKAITLSSLYTKIKSLRNGSNN
jgi:glycosyltransferase involved in cell wall biosynthesis